jgi:hypothetical protein
MGFQIPKPKEAVVLCSEDRMRMVRLYEEVQTRLDEMAMIVARTLGLQAGPTAQVKFSPRFADSEVTATAVEIVSTPRGCGCYDYTQGTCFES